MRGFPLSLSCLAFTVAALGCGSPAPRRVAGPPILRVDAVAASIASADGTPIRYQSAGQGAPALVFIHGWALDQSYWAEQVQHFAPTHQVITLDLAGHGESGRGRREWTLASLGEDVRAVVAALAPGRVVLVGHSLGGYAALEAYRLMPGKVAGIVGVDSFQEIDNAAAAAARRETLLAELDRDFPAGARRLAGALLPRNPGAALKEQIEAQFAGAPPAVAVPLLRAAWSYDLAAALERVRVPVRALDTTQASDVAAARRHCPDFTLVDLTAAGLGHFPMIEAPALFDEKLEEAVRDLR
jgi:pimeloyl-ACP methyl ester carboxylesterase